MRFIFLFFPRTFHGGEEDSLKWVAKMNWLFELMQCFIFFSREVSNRCRLAGFHYSDVIMSTMASQPTDISIVYSTVCSGIDQRKHQSSASLAFVRESHWWLVNSLHKGPVMRKMFPFDDVIMNRRKLIGLYSDVIWMWWCLKSLATWLFVN